MSPNLQEESLVDRETDSCGNNSASRARLRYLRYPICLSFTLVPLHLSFVPGDQRRGVPS